MAFLLKKAVSSKMKKSKESLEDILFETRIYTTYTRSFFPPPVFLNSFFLNNEVVNKRVTNKKGVKKGGNKNPTQNSTQQ